MSQTTPSKDLGPDNQILSHIFPASAPASITILAQTYETCIFIAKFDNPSPLVLSKDLVVRLEVSSSDGSRRRLHTVSALQKVAALAIPNLVPEVTEIGVTRTSDGIEAEYSVTAFIPDSVTLEAVWDVLTERQQSTIVKEVVGAMNNLYSLSPSDARVRRILEGTPFVENLESPNVSATALGGPDVGYFQNVPDLLKGITNALNGRGSKPIATFHAIADGSITITPVNDEPAAVHIPHDDLISLLHPVVLSHNDLEPRNILVSTPISGDDVVHVKAIIDWEMVGFFPLGYEFVMKDVHMGSSNLSFRWYSLFKQHATPSLGGIPIPPTPLSLHGGS
ncbi:hypothetical protein JAAARDRAFT_134450 [Jaapia argillacea MUCL 33604]|uniref:Aminoglycoside phosphotransferase domain-containing protein n=1 Tax=Jaapia argillacea MUCL 33604 TaxID=933084 RepID=A0A067PMR2_9AGAM|nr:hypothetical protein JAAARDRAFT_134450 [Jaapia argillacea MUCL 33604]